MKKKLLIPIIIFTLIIILLIIVLNPKTKYKKLSVSEDKWNSIINARSQTDDLVLEDIEFDDYNLIIDEKDDTIYYSLINDDNTKFNPSVVFKASDSKAKLAFLSDEITDEKIKNNHEFKVMIYTKSQYHIYNLICTDLPILNISYKGKAGKKQKSIPMEIYLVNNLTNTPNKITTSRGKLKINDDNYTFSLNMITPGNNVRENKISLFNMKPDSEYVLNKVEDATEDGEKQSDKHRLLLFINGEYKGIYILGYADEKR